MDHTLGREVKVFDDLDALSKAAAAFVVAELTRTIEDRSVATLALAGGDTPKRLYEILSRDYRNSDCWKHTHFFLGDERYVSPNDPESNYRMVRETLFDPLGIPPVQIHHPFTALPSPAETAEKYEKDLRAFFDPNSVGFDIILLGMGNDGHTASIFPETLMESVADRQVIATMSPLPPRDRISVTLSVINASRIAMFLISGKTKSSAFAQVLQLADDPNAPLPAARVRAREQTLFFVDHDAASSYRSAGES